MNVIATLNYINETRYPEKGETGLGKVIVEVSLTTLSDLYTPHKFPIRLLQTRVVDNYKTIEQSIKPMTGNMRDDMNATLMIEEKLIEMYVYPKMRLDNFEDEEDLPFALHVEAYDDGLPF